MKSTIYEVQLMNFFSLSLRIFVAFIFLVFFPPRALFSSDVQEFLDEDVDLDAIYFDLPSDFDISTASVFSLVQLPYFSLESALRVIAARDSLPPEHLKEYCEVLTGLSPMEHAVLGYVLSMQSGVRSKESVIRNQESEIRKRKTESQGVRFSIRQGIVHDPDREDATDSRYYAKLFARSPQGMTVSLIGERDRFEPRALDFVSGSGEFTVDRGRTSIIIGDYRPGFGQGLLFSRYGRMYGNGADIMQRKPSYSVNTSWEETKFLRGAFLAVRRNRITTETWFSIRSLDATLDAEGVPAGVHAVTIRETGIHRSGENRGNLTERIHGARFEVSPVRDFTIAATGVVSVYSPSLARKEGESSYHDPEGSTFRYIALDGSFQRGPAAFFFEHAVMNRAETGTTAGIEFSKSEEGVPLLRGCIAVRRYTEGYWSYRSGGFSSFGDTSNEQGVYSAVQAHLPGNMNINASMDLARMLYRSTSAPMPLSRRRLNIVLRTPSRSGRRSVGLTMWIGYRSVAEGVPIDDGSPSVSSERQGDESQGRRSVRWNVRLGCDKRMVGTESVPFDALRLRSMVVWSSGYSDGSGGPYLESSLIFRIRRKAFRCFGCTLTGGLFDLPSYDARFYRYEYDVPGRGYTRPVWGRGGTAIAVLRWNPLSLRYRYSNSDLMDSSHEVTMQLDMIF